MPLVALIHSPLVGPTSWQGVAGVLAAAGTPVVVPDLTVAAQTGTMDAVVAAAASHLTASDVLLVGHSGAGMLLPAIADVLMGRVTGFCFVDAHLPPVGGAAPLAEGEFLELLGSLAQDGRLPPWCEWWGPEALRRLVPSKSLRTALCDEMPRLPLAYFEQQVLASSDWATRPCGYVRLSETYESSAAEAEALGWPVERFAGGHLDTAVDPVRVAGALRGVCAL